MSNLVASAGLHFLYVSFSLLELRYVTSLLFSQTVVSFLFNGVCLWLYHSEFHKFVLSTRSVYYLIVKIKIINLKRIEYMSYIHTTPGSITHRSKWLRTDLTNIPVLSSIVTVVAGPKPPRNVCVCTNEWIQARLSVKISHTN